MLAVDSAFKSVVLGDIDSLKNSVAEIKLELRQLRIRSDAYSPSPVQLAKYRPVLCICVCAVG